MVLSTGAAHSLSDALGEEAGTEPTEVSAEPMGPARGCAGCAASSLRGEIQRYLLTVLDMAGVDLVAAEKLTVIPGSEEVLALLEVRVQARSGRWDVLVLGCAPHGGDAAVAGTT